MDKRYPILAIKLEELLGSHQMMHSCGVQEGLLSSSTMVSTKVKFRVHLVWYRNSVLGELQKIDHFNISRTNIIILTTAYRC